jgi:hypothetical protein
MLDNHLFFMSQLPSPKPPPELLNIIFELAICHKFWKETNDINGRDHVLVALCLVNKQLCVSPKHRMMVTSEIHYVGPIPT